MLDYLRVYCKKLKIKLVYTKNKTVILSTGINDGIHMIRAHSKFRGCPQSIAYAIVNYYTKSQSSEKNLDIIKKYVEEGFDLEKYSIITRDEQLNKLRNYEKNINIRKENASLEEITISKIIQMDIYGNVSQLEPQDVINTSENDLLQLDIIINSFRE